MIRTTRQNDLEPDSESPIRVVAITSTHDTLGTFGLNRLHSLDGP